MGLVHDSMTTCRGKRIKSIELHVVSSPPRLTVRCHTDWYGFLRREAKALGYDELTITKKMLEAKTDLKKYDETPMTTVHAELQLAMRRKLMSKFSRGEIGVSKSCCATCTEGLSALRNLGYEYTVKSSHAKPYIARLTELSQVDKAIVGRIQNDFETWLRSIIIEPDSDVSDHETASHSDDQQQVAQIVIKSLGVVAHKSEYI